MIIISKNKINRYYILFIFLLLATAKSMAQFTSKEIALINSGSENMPFGVLLTTNEEDSLFLRKKCIDIDKDNIVGNKDLELLIERMITTMDAESGVGLAAPQIGIGRNLFIFVRVDDPDYPIGVAINPRIINHPDETICFEGDGCLSIPNTSGNSIRYPWIEVEYTDPNGDLVQEKLEGFSRDDNFVGIIFQHEYDHLQGILFIDKLCTDIVAE